MINCKILKGKRWLPLSVASVAFWAILHPAAYAGGNGGLIGNTVKDLTSTVNSLTKTLPNTIVPSGPAPGVPGAAGGSASSPGLGSVLPSGLQKNFNAVSTDDGMTSIAVQKNLVKNPAGGNVTVPQTDFNGLASKAVNIKGIHQANSVTVKNGVIVLGGGDTVLDVKTNKVADTTIDKVSRLHNALKEDKSDESSTVIDLFDKAIDVNFLNNN